MGQVITIEPDTPLGKLFAELQEAYVGFPWCKCEAPDLGTASYFEHKHGVSHGWECSECHGVIQVG